MRRLPDRKQQGAIGVFGTLVFLLVILFAALAIDSARLWMVKRQLQKVADISAIEASKALSCNVTLSDVIAKAQQAAAANGFLGNLSSLPNVVEVGNVTTVGGRRQFSADGTPRAVHVRVSQQVASSLVVRGFYAQDIVLSAEAVSLPSNSLASFGIGTTAAKLNTQDSVLLNQLLGEMLGTSIDLDLVAYKGLALSNLTLANLIKADGQLLTVDELLNAQFTPRQLLTLISSAVALSDNVIPEALGGITELANAAVENTTLSLGQVLNVNQGIQTSAANVDINALTLITSLIQLSNGQNSINLPTSVNVGGLLSLGTNITVIEPAQMTIGPPADNNGVACTVVRSAQVRIDTPILLNIPFIARIDLNLGIEVASGSASLKSIKSKGDATELVFDTSTSLLTTRLTNVAKTGPAKITSLLNIPLAELGLNLAAPASNTNEVVTEVERPVADHLPQVISVNSGLATTFEQIFSQPSVIEVNVLGLNLPVINTLVTTVVAPLLVAVSKAVIDPLLNILGVKLNNMDVIVEDVILTNRAPLVI